MRDIIMTVAAVVLVGVITGKAVVSAVTHVIAWFMTKLAEKRVFNVDIPDYYEFYAHGGTDIEH